MRLNEEKQSGSYMNKYGGSRELGLLVQLSTSHKWFGIHRGPHGNSRPWCVGLGCRDFTLRSNGHVFITLDLAFTKYKPGGDTKYILQVPNFKTKIDQSEKFQRKTRTIKVLKDKSYEKIQKNGLCLFFKERDEGEP